MTAKDQGDSESISQAEYFTLTKTHTCAHYQQQQGEEERVLCLTEILAVKCVMTQRYLSHISKDEGPEYILDMKVLN